MNLNRLLAALTDETLAEFFSSNALTRGRGYVTRVGRIDVAGNTLSANIQGTQRQPYRTTVRLDMRALFGEPSLEITATCTCPVGSRCKHAAALLLAARRPGCVSEQPRREVLDWARSLGVELARESRRGRAPQKNQVGIFYALTGGEDGAFYKLATFKAALGANGGFASRGTPWYNHEQALVKPPSFVVESDLAVFRALRRLRRDGQYGFIRFEDAPGAELLDALLDTQRVYVAADSHHPLRALTAGKPRAVAVDWQPGKLGVAPRVRAEPGDAPVLATRPLRYLDSAMAQAGPVRCAHETAILALMRLPPLNAAEVPLVTAALAEHAPKLPTPGGAATLPTIDTEPQPRLTLDSAYAWQIDPHRDYRRTTNDTYDFACAEFRYGDAIVPAGSDDTLLSLPDGRAVRVHRRPDAEAAAMAALKAAGFAPVPERKVHAFSPLPPRALGLASDDAWTRFFAEQAPALRSAGWHIDCAPDFRHLVFQVDDWFADLEEDDAGWFALTLGIEVDGQRLDLAPLLHTLFHHDPRWRDPQALAQIPDDEAIDLHTPEGMRIVVPAGRVKPLATTLIDLFDSDAEGSRRVAVLDAPRLAAALDTGWQQAGFAPLAAWQAKLAGMHEVRPVAPPAGLGLQLRPYQREGLAWLQHLRAHDLGGVLADDMGLGKTAQTLAHLLIEKESGRMDRPSLIVLPTSLVFNWQREAARFAPSLRVLKLHGKDRAAQFEAIADHDVCLTTYPLLWRDIDTLAAHDYHLLILDEAQTVKNANSHAARAVRRLQSRHRLCLTGTPLENHLGELWSQFDFLLPGFLGTSADFTRRWRTPIEKHGDGVRRELLARRLAPFVLRRLKDRVATELPPKTVVVRGVELTGRQRDLYETVRVAMDKRLRAAIAERGLARSRIQILDALLKLRQVCCDARLLKTPAAQKVRERAKLDLLMQMVPALVEEGRRILIFSQFTEMLALIEAELDALGIGWVKLTGQTRKREAAIERFQNGDVPVFLISLKAGGVGLNLTAADTVIHYDPWWNPAAENQATDRAHRIGQDKPVFVYKLVVEGSIEEKILDLQARKAELAESVIHADGAALAKFDPVDLERLFEPLPPV
ncbi:DEAD/DEAH box helicase [Denitromonas iodatirespirans]|uniref:DEAD/DEAH box helicase n=1 Tax=Denitromonas iodatirespirans TaxID=2795389 RepID=A0A944D8W4_DENI1|nr:DEAD/DEAH box helicase [Denitromonas iodatirespirans]MBT0962295.1 DEAD/DEAH box helicase [Denitromonas iodatirespirans]